MYRLAYRRVRNQGGRVNCVVSHSPTGREQWERTLAEWEKRPDSPLENWYVFDGGATVRGGGNEDAAEATFPLRTGSLSFMFICSLVFI